jgi:hypothetical protein
MDKRFSSYGCFKRPKKGYFRPFFGVKLKINFLSIFEGIFSSSLRTIFSRIPRNISALTDKWFSNYGRSRRPKKGYFWPFLGGKTENQLLQHFGKNFFHQVQKLFLLRSHAKFHA